MKKIVTSRDLQRNDFVKSLYEKIHRNAVDAYKEHRKNAMKASSYLRDGLSPSECVELLILDGLTREASMKYVDMAEDAYEPEEAGRYTYSFTFEDTHGRIWNSHEIGKIITADNDEDAWIKAEAFLGDDSQYESELIVSVDKIG